MPPLFGNLPAYGLPVTGLSSMKMLASGTFTFTLISTSVASGDVGKIVGADVGCESAVDAVVGRFVLDAGSVTRYTMPPASAAASSRPATTMPLREVTSGGFLEAESTSDDG